MNHLQVMEMNQTSSINRTNITLVFVGGGSLRAYILNVLDLMWVSVLMNSGKEYSITNALIKCPSPSDVSGLVLIQILELGISPSASRSVNAPEDICLRSRFQRRKGEFFLFLHLSFIRITLSTEAAGI